MQFLCQLRYRQAWVIQHRAQQIIPVLVSGLFDLFLLVVGDRQRRDSPNCFPLVSTSLSLCPGTSLKENGVKSGPRNFPCK